VDDLVERVIEWKRKKNELLHDLAGKLVAEKGRPPPALHVLPYTAKRGAQHNRLRVVAARQRKRITRRDRV
jgi:hypothetical protein